jgi:hypothetical protein
MHGAGKVPRGFELPLDERLVDDYFRGNVCQLAFLPRLHLLSHRLEVSLHSINANRDAVDELYKKGCQEKNSPSTGGQEDLCLDIQPTVCTSRPLIRSGILLWMVFPSFGFPCRWRRCQSSLRNLASASAV